MRLTILSQNLSDQSEEVFYHEFHNVHAKQVSDIAANSGILYEYLQGMSPVLRREKPTLPLPLPTLSVNIISAAQLTWPSISVMRGLFSSSGYQKEAGAHIFAKAQTVYVTKNLESEDGRERNSSQARIFCLLRPIDEHFQSSWKQHSEVVRSLPLQPVLYQRHESCPLSREETDALFKGTQFAVGEGNIIDGGIDEYLFSTAADLERFLVASSEILEASYKKFVDDKRSSAAVFDQTVVYEARQRGIYQSLVGSLLSSALFLKDSLRL